uniref:Uncharacterized protein n=1 Tax=viral metagenome TaxID=1070528 RepID=A0A6M3LT57_9ZZZZ
MKEIEIKIYTEKEGKDAVERKMIQFRNPTRREYLKWRETLLNAKSERDKVSNGTEEEKLETDRKILSMADDVKYSLLIGLNTNKVFTTQNDFLDVDQENLREILAWFNEQMSEDTDRFLKK